MPGLETSAFPTGRSKPVPGSISSSCSVPRNRSRSCPTVTFGLGTDTPLGTRCFPSFPDYFLQMRQCRVCSTLPRKLLGEPAPGRAEDVNEIARLDYSSHGSRHGARIIRRHQESSLAVDHRLADPRRIRCDHGRGTRCSLEIADSPPFLWRRQRRCPRAAKKMKLRLLRNEAEELYSIIESERVYQSFELSAIVSGSGNLESGFRDVQLGERADDHVDALVFLQPAKVYE